MESWVVEGRRRVGLRLRGKWSLRLWGLWLGLLGWLEVGGVVFAFFKVGGWVVVKLWGRILLERGLRGRRRRSVGGKSLEDGG